MRLNDERSHPSHDHAASSTGGSGSGGGGSLAEHFTERWGAKRATRKAARRRFTESLAAYGSLL